MDRDGDSKFETLLRAPESYYRYDNKGKMVEVIQGEFVLSEPITDLSKVAGSFRKEIDYLIEKGYKLSQDGKELVK